MKRLATLAIFAAMLFAIGCDDASGPTKPAGPGGLRQQPYSPPTGQYAPNK